jgi:hypothetical protein
MTSEDHCRYFACPPADTLTRLGHRTFPLIDPGCSRVSPDKKD